MGFGREDILRAAELARLELTEDEIVRFAQDLDRITAYVAMLQNADLSDQPAAPVLPVAPIADSLRDDVVRPSLTPEEATASAPDARDGLFRVPKVIG